MGFKTVTKKVAVSIDLIFNKVIEVPANWTGDQIDEFIGDVDIDMLYESTPDEISVGWRLLKK